MSPQTQLRWTIIAALLMWSPAAVATITGSSDILRSGILFVGALIVSYIGLTIIAYLINSYQQTQDMVARAQKQIEYIERRNAEDAEGQDDETDSKNRRSGD
jgi:hypothetical protein